MFITAADLETNIYPEGMDAITRDDDTIVEAAINNAQLEAAYFLSRYDVAAIWAASDEDKVALYGHLINMIKNIAKWNLVQRGNAGVEFDVAEIAYKAAIKALERISKVVQPGWPLIDTEADRPFSSGSRRKFDHHGDSYTVDNDNPF